MKHLFIYHNLYPLQSVGSEMLDLKYICHGKHMKAHTYVSSSAAERNNINLAYKMIHG